MRAAEQQRGVSDYIGAGPFRLTPTKDSGRPPLGVDGYRELVAVTALSIVAIGDVTPADAAALAGVGEVGVVMVWALIEASDPGAVMREVPTGFEGGTNRP
ncbi:thiamine phosphate synthase [Citricoccus nitrophenolicus]